MKTVWDYRFEITRVEEPEMGCTHTVRIIEQVICPPDERFPVETIIDGDVIDHFTTDNPHADVEAFREVQATTLEERMEPFGLYFERGW